MAITADTTDLELNQLVQHCNYAWAQPRQMLEVLLWTQREVMRLRRQLLSIETMLDRHPNSPPF